MPELSPAGPELELEADCSRCSGLCCVLLPYRRDAGFGADKPGGVPCHHLTPADRCGIHEVLRERGWSGCAAFDCFGAGQHVTQVTYGGTSWRDLGDLGEMAAVLSSVRRIHEMLAYLAEAGRRSPEPRADALRRRLLVLRDATPVELLTADLEELHEAVGEALDAASARVRGAGSGPDLARTDLSGHDLRGRDLRAARLRGATLIGADLRDLDLGAADLLGADLRGADLRGTRLGDALFLTRPQLASARGDGRTEVPEGLRRPGHWS